MEPDADAGRIARVAVDVPLGHLDRPFDYRIGAGQVPTARPGVRVRVRFAGRLRDGYLLEVTDTSEVDASLAPLERVSSAEVVLTPEVAGLTRAVADHWGGTFADVVRLAVPPRHAATERAAAPTRPAPELSGDPVLLPEYPGGDRFLAGLAGGEALRALWNPVPAWGVAWADGIIDAATATLRSGRGVAVVVPDAEALAHLRVRCEERLGAGSFAVLSAETGPAARYRNFLAVVRGQARMVIGTRAAVYAPVHDLGLLVVWDEGNDLLSEPRAPYPHAREVAMLRASRDQIGLLLAGYGRSAESQALVERSWLVPLSLPAREIRQRGPAVRVASVGDFADERDPAARTARLPHDVFTAIRSGLSQGPVLLQVPRTGYAPSLACQRCRTLARCPRCSYPLRGERGTGGIAVRCPSCGPVTPWQCPSCGDSRLRAPQVGAARTAEELRRAFPHVDVLTSWSGQRVTATGAEPALVVATPGAEPRPAKGYAAAVLLDTGLLLGRPDLRAAEEALRRWLEVCALVRPASAGGTVMAVGEPRSRALQALVRLDAAGFAARELDERTATRFPPAARMVTVDGSSDALDGVEAAAAAVPGLEVFGPVPLADDLLRLTLRVAPAQGKALIDAISAESAARSARKAPAIRVKVDPVAL
ncbi:MAG: primosomal protein N' [Propioniciclava sp.]